MPTRRHHLVIAAVATIAVVLVGIARSGSDNGDKTTDNAPRVAASTMTEPAMSRDRPADRPPTATRPIRSKQLGATVDRRERDRIRQLIDSSLAARPEPTQATPAQPPPSPGGFLERFDEHNVLIEQLTADFLPLAQECIRDALERDPSLVGTLAADFHLIGAPELGTIIESTSTSPRNGVTDPELLQCVEQTALSTVLTAPGTELSDTLLLSLELDVATGGQPVREEVHGPPPTSTPPAD